MFPTFSGNSRRPRNVNLSGQKSNPFAGTSWNPPSSTGSSKSVAEAQAERQKRQQERDRLKAALRIQRTWRGHRTRQRLRQARRRDFDALYGSGQAAQDVDRRLLEAFPLLQGSFRISSDEDCGRLLLLVRDLEQTHYEAVSSNRIPPRRLEQLVRMLAAVLILRDTADSLQDCIFALIRIAGAQPQSVYASMDTYYTLLGRLCTRDDASDPERARLLREAVAVPLVTKVTTDFAAKAYRAFLLHLLSMPVPFQASIDPIAGSIDIDRLSTAVLDVFASGTTADLSKEHCLWLLARFIDLQHAKSGSQQSSTYAKALYLQLSSLAGDIRVHFQTRIPRTEEAKHSGSLPEYVRKQLLFLVDRHEISGLLQKFKFLPPQCLIQPTFSVTKSGNSNYVNASDSASQDASTLAGYILTLIRCFPGYGDDIRMRLYLSDLASPSGQIPSTRYFYKATAATKVFSRIVRNEKATLTFLLQRKYFQPSSTRTEDSEWNREWRTVLLFLELYVFVLRLTDDEDFFAGFSAETDVEPPSRLGACSLQLDEAKNLSLFLKNLGFTLHYHAAELLQGDGAKEASGVAYLSDVASMNIVGAKGKGRSAAKAPPAFNVVSGIDFDAFRNIVTTAMRMLYERDSRRRFLPADHWLMTSKFDMDGLLSAVVLEDERRRELRENGDEDSSSEADGDDDDDEDTAMVGSSSHQPVSWAGQRRSRHALMEQFRARHKRQQRERSLAMIGPTLEILRSMPFVIPFEMRVKIFRQFVLLDKYRRRGGHVDPDQWRYFMMHQSGNPWDPLANSSRSAIGRHHAKIRRGNVFNDALEQFYELGDGLKEPIQITFVDQFDTVEAGIDGGGVTKEFLTSVTMEAFTSSQHNLFVANSSAALYPSPYALDQLHETLRRAGMDERSEEWKDQVQSLLEQYEFLGRIVGKCMYEGILIDVAFAGFFLLKWASSSATDSGYRASINDLREMDEELYQGLLRLKHMPGDDVSALELDFTINDQISLPGETTATLTRNLMPGGRDIAVTNENRPLYMSYVARHRLVVQPYQQTRAFLRGLGSIVDPSWLSMFNQSELQRLVGGDPSEIDVEDLRRNTLYSGVYEIGDDGLEHPTVELFWRAMREFRDDERRAVLKYVTSTPRAPLLGFSQLKPAFSIRDGGGDPDRLPSASTCVNLLKLPRYNNLDLLKSKLKYAISSNAGFDLS